MATSILMASSDRNTNLTLPDDHHNHHHVVQTKLTPPTITRHDHHQTSRQSNSTARGRRKTSSRGNESKKKQPQRGMGVAQLERLRLGDRWKKMTEFSQSPQPSVPYAVFPSPTSFGHDPTSLNTVPMQLAAKLGVYPLNLNQPTMLDHRVSNNNSTTVGLLRGQGLVSDDNKFQGNLYGVGVGKGSETSSNELSSTPNLIKCYSDRCTVCHLKKRNVSRENLVLKGSVEDMNASEMPSITSSDFVGLNSPNNNRGTNQDFGKKGNFHAGAYSAGGTVYQGVEVVAVHTKASSSVGGSANLLMEYEFFPSGKGGSRNDSHGSDRNDELMRVMMMKKVSGSESSSSVAAAVTGRGHDVSCAMTTTITDDIGVAVDGSDSIDLSLRLSY